MPPAPSRAFARFSLFVLVYTLGVILLGAYVRASFSGDGCGDHWPSCHGELIPTAPALKTVVEFSHRVTSGLALVLSLVALAWGFRAHPKGHPVRLGVALGLAFMLSEALVGAGLVLLRYVAYDPRLARAAWMAAHLVNTFLLVGAQALTLFWARGTPRTRLGGQGGFGWLVGALLGGVVLLGVSGAVTALGDTLFPLASSQDTFSPAAHLFVRLRVLHPLLAVVLGALVVAGGWAAARLRPAAGVRRAAGLLSLLYAVQLGAGVLNYTLHAPVWLQLTHLLLADGVWIALVWLAAEGLALGAPRGALAPAAEPLPRG